MAATELVALRDLMNITNSGNNEFYNDIEMYLLWLGSVLVNT